MFESSSTGKNLAANLENGKFQTVHLFTSAKRSSSFSSILGGAQKEKRIEIQMLFPQFSLVASHSIDNLPLRWRSATGATSSIKPNSIVSHSRKWKISLCDDSSFLSILPFLRLILNISCLRTMDEISSEPSEHFPSYSFCFLPWCDDKQPRLPSSVMA